MVPGEGSRGERLAALEQSEAAKRKAALAKRQGEAAAARLDQAVYIHLASDEPHSAAMLLGYVAWFLPDSEQAAEAKTKLAEIESNHPELLAVLKGLGLEKGK